MPFSEATYNWETEDLTVHINLSGGQLMKIGCQPAQFSIGGRCYAESPANASESGACAGIHR